MCGQWMPPSAWVCTWWQQSGCPYTGCVRLVIGSFRYYSTYGSICLQPPPSSGPDSQAGSQRVTPSSSSLADTYYSGCAYRCQPCGTLGTPLGFFPMSVLFVLQGVVDLAISQP